MAKLDYIQVGGVKHEIVPEIAPLFDTTTAYEVGDCVIKDAVMYRFNTAHPAGAWVGTDADEITVGGELTSIGYTLNTVANDVTELENVDYHILLNSTYTGTGLTTVSVDIPAGTYIIDVDNIESTDSDSSKCNIAFVYTTSGGAYALLNRGANIQSKITLENSISQIVFYASDSYAHSSNDTFTFTGFKLCRIYQLMDDIAQSRDTRDIVKDLISNLSSYEIGERVYTSSRLTYVNNGKVVYGTTSGYDTYEYTINRPTLFKVTGKTKGASNYLAIGADNDGNVLQLKNQGISGTETQYTDYVFTIDTFGVTKVYICLFASENDSVLIGAISNGGVSDYDALENRPQINSVTMTGNKTSSDLGLADEQEVSKIKNLQEDAVFTGSYNGTTLTSVSVNIPAGTYVLDIASVTSADTDDTTSFISFIYTGSGSLGVNVSRGNNIRKKIVLEKSVTTIYLYAANGYAHSVGDAFSFTGFKIVSSYPLMLQLDELKESVNELAGNSAAWDNGDRTYSASTFTYAGSNGQITSGSLNGYATYTYSISGKTKFKVTGNTRGADNYLALGANDSGTVLQRVEKGTAGTSTPYNNYEFVIDDPAVTKVYICLYESASDDVKIEVVQNNDELSILFVGNSLTQDGIA